MTPRPQDLTQFNGYAPSLPDKGTLTEMFKRIADFLAKSRKTPDPKFIDKTPDGKADTLVISYIENRLDELYSGLWQTKDFKMMVVANEIIGTITLSVFHPECGVWLDREGVAAIQVMVDKVPEGITGTARNQWALDLSNKKPNCLQTQSGRLKAEAIKNAAKSLGVTFGRELNRRKSDTEFNPDVYDEEGIEVRDEITHLIETALLPAAELEACKKFAQDPNTPFTRLEGIKQRLTDNQKKS